ncbi:MAG: hypothetical protein IT222_07845 [Crocinitomix sp.]|nr:hypothetical protein [Crocinitomix sp.]
MIYKIIIVFAFFCSFIGNSKNYIPYYNLTNKAEWFYDNQEFDSAKFYFEQAFKMEVKKKTKDVWIYIKILNAEGKSHKIYKILKDHLNEIGGGLEPVSKYLKKDGIVMKDKQYAKLDAIMRDSTLAFWQEEKEIYRILEEMDVKDNWIRKGSEHKLSDTILHPTTHKQITIKEMMIEVDSLNYLEFKRLFEEFHLADHEIDGAVLSNLLLHQTRHFFQLEENYTKMLMNGNVDPWIYASSFDRALSHKNGQHRYFAYPYNAQDLKCIYYEEVIKNRLSIGLSIYYSRPSFRFHIRVGRMMKVPFKQFYEAELAKKN